MNGDNRPWSEIWHEAAQDWVDKQDAADILENTKTAVLAQKCSMLGEMAVNKAEQTVKASREWHDHLEVIAKAKKVANAAWVEMEYYKMKFNVQYNKS